MEGTFISLINILVIILCVGYYLVSKRLLLQYGICYV